MKVENLSFKYYEKSKNLILENINFSVPENDISLLIGKSGCGKSTLAYILAGLLPDNGGIIINGQVTFENINLQNISIKERVSTVSMMFQNPDLQFCMSNLKDEIIFSLENIGLNKSEIDKEIELSTEIIGTKNLLHKEFNTLSGGEKQKCALTCIVALKSKYIILDEPFANIDPKSALELIEIISKLNEKNKTTFLIIDHIVDRWIGHCHNIFMLENNHTINKIHNNSFNDFVKPEIIRFKNNNLNIENDNLNIENNNLNIENKSDIIKINNLSIKIDNKQILKNINLSIEKGGINCIVGASGCGKSTFLKSLYGKVDFSGNIFIDNLKVCKKNYRKICEIMGIVLQNPKNQFVSQKVIDEINFSFKSNSNANNKSAVEYLEDFHLKVYQNYSPYMLSQGQQRRLAVLSMLCCNQKILILDEPTYGQDSESTYKIMELITEKVENEGLTVLFTTHDLNLAYTYSHKIFEMKNEVLYEIY